MAGTEPGPGKGIDHSVLLSASFVAPLLVVANELCNPPPMHVSLIMHVGLAAGNAGDFEDSK